MDIIEPLKRLAGNATGIGIPNRDEALACVCECHALQLKFRDDGYIPNNPNFRFSILEKLCASVANITALLEKLFNLHGWGGAWRNGIYDFVHYHPMIHEVYRSSSRFRHASAWRKQGTDVKVSAGDVIVVPAGVGHECLKASKKFLVVGAYPPTGTYSECRGSFQERDQAIKRIRCVGVSDILPLYGRSRTLW